MKNLIQILSIILYIILKCFFAILCCVKIIWSYDWRDIQNVLLYIYLIVMYIIHLCTMVIAERRKMCTLTGRIWLVCVDVFSCAIPVLIYFIVIINSGFYGDPFDIIVFQIIIIFARILDVHSFCKRLRNKQNR